MNIICVNKDGGPYSNALARYHNVTNIPSVGDTIKIDGVEYSVIGRIWDYPNNTLTLTIW